MSPPTQERVLKANYSSPSGSRSFQHTLPSLPTLPTDLTTQEKTSYLSNLRSSTTNLQGDINAFLTANMEEDKRTASQGTGKMDDKREEENYGEEVTDDNA
ncbi:hypothetical protein MMC19_005166 [Ptychographa xylographoides]|nr:hypothetical protein [Ptychographa xylographoides]